MTDPAKSGERGVMDLLRSSKAIVGRRQVHSDCGGATIHCVVLADGALIECGSDGYAEDRARLLAAAVNQFGPERFAFGRPPPATRP
jgi:hypothetical protein